MKPTIQLQARLTEPQAERLRHRVAALPYKVKYHEEQQGPALIGIIHCTASQEMFVREILHDVGAAEEEPLSFDHSKGEKTVETGQ